MAERTPADYIDAHKSELRELNEHAFLDAVHDIGPLPDTESPEWRSDDATEWDQAMRLIAAADIVGERGWTNAVAPIFERAALGDLFGMMQSIRHGPEKALSPEELAVILEPLMTHPRAGTRQWVARELGILRLGRSRPLLERALQDPVEDVREEAELSLKMLRQARGYA